MSRTALLALALAASPLAALAMPQVGDMIGTNPDDATLALKDKGCTVDEFEVEGGKIEAKCYDTAQKLWEVYIDPASGKVVQIKEED